MNRALSCLQYYAECTALRHVECRHRRKFGTLNDGTLSGHFNLHRIKCSPSSYGVHVSGPMPSINAMHWLRSEGPVRRSRKKGNNERANLLTLKKNHTCITRRIRMSENLDELLDGRDDELLPVSVSFGWIASRLHVPTFRSYDHPQRLWKTF